MNKLHPTQTLNIWEVRDLNRLKRLTVYVIIMSRYTCTITLYLCVMLYFCYTYATYLFFMSRYHDIIVCYCHVMNPIAETSYSSLLKINLV